MGTKKIKEEGSNKPVSRPRKISLNTNARNADRSVPTVPTGATGGQFKGTDRGLDDWQNLSIGIAENVILIAWNVTDGGNYHAGGR